MTQDPAKRSLGRGLSALLGSPAAEGEIAAAAARSLRTIPVEQVHPGRFQPRQRFDDAEMAALAESVRAKGILQPILVRPKADSPGAFEIVAGERRWRAAQLAQMHEIPAIIRELTDQDALELAIVENVQRQDLSPIEEAEGYRRLMDEFGNTQDDLAQHVGKSRSHIANTVRLLSLPESVRNMLENSQISVGHARALLNSPDALAMAMIVASKGLNVRQTERLVQSGRSTAAKIRRRREKDSDTRALERDLTARLGLNVSIAPDGEAGEIAIRYKTLEQLEMIAHRLRGPQGMT